MSSQAAWHHALLQQYARLYLADSRSPPGHLSHAEGETAVSARLIGDLRIARKAADHAFDKFVRQLSGCRECGEVAGFFDKICRHCGAGNPVKIPVSASVMITAVAAQMAIVFLRAL